MILSLRTRLLVGVTVLVALGLTAAGAVTYNILQKNLIGRVDEELLDGRGQAIGALLGLGGGGGGDRQIGLPVGTYVALYSPAGARLTEGHVVASIGGALNQAGSAARPVLPQPLPYAGADQPAMLTVKGTGGVAKYDLLVESVDQAGGDLLVVAIPLTDVQNTLDQLLLLEAAVGLAVLAVMVAGGFWLIRLGLRPLERIGATAAAIAAGDLSRRVEPATPKTEVGRLGLALNSMLEQIESAFAERTRSEQRLRQFLADASHELRTPLTSIRGYAEMLRRGAQGSAEDSEVARRRIEEESKRMTALVEDMLLLARLDQGRPLERRPVELDRLAADACADAKAVAPDREVRLESPAHVIVSGDELRLRQVVGNLVRNAVVHTPPEAPIEVTVGVQDGHAALSVVDHGPGLPPEHAERVFEPFYRGHPGRSRDSGGAGLGLSIVGAVVGAHEGEVRFEPTPGGGATFTVVLPLATA